MSYPADDTAMPRLVVEAVPIPALLLTPGSPVLANRAARTLFRLQGDAPDPSTLPPWLLTELYALLASEASEACVEHLPLPGSGRPLKVSLRKTPPSVDAPDGGVLAFLQERPLPVPPAAEATEDATVPLVRLLQTLLGNLKLRVFFKDVDSVYLAVSESFAADFGRSPEDFVGKTDFDFFSDELASGFQEDDRRVMQSREAGSYLEEHEVRGEWRYLEIAKAPVLSDNDGVVGIIGMYQDVTERHQMEDRLARERELLHALMDNVPDLIYFKDAGSRFTRINWAQAAHLGLAHPDEAAGKTDFNFYPPELAQEFLADEQELMRSGRPVLNKLERQSSGGPVPEVQWLLTTKAPLSEPDGGARGLVGISRDVTDRIRIEETLRQTAEELAASNQELQQFANVASHDLQEPLRVIQNYLQRLGRC
jgi:PAS domain S-box-containing protein